MKNIIIALLLITILILILTDGNKEAFSVQEPYDTIIEINNFYNTYEPDTIFLGRTHRETFQITYSVGSLSQYIIGEYREEINNNPTLVTMQNPTFQCIFIEPRHIRDPYLRGVAKDATFLTICPIVDNNIMSGFVGITNTDYRDLSPQLKKLVKEIT